MQFHQMDEESKKVQLNQLYLLCLGIMLLKSFIKKDLETQFKCVFLSHENIEKSKKSNQFVFIMVKQINL